MTGVRALTSHQCGPGLNTRPSVIAGLSLFLVLVLALRVPSKKKYFPFQIDRENMAPHNRVNRYFNLFS